MQTEHIMEESRVEQVDAQTWKVQLAWPDANGLRGREAAMLLKLGRSHNATLVLECFGQKADAESFMGLLSLEAPSDAPLTVTASGPEAEQLVRAIAHCFQSGFESAAGSMGKTCFRQKFERHFHLPQ